MCISNGVGDALMSNARWTGVPLRTLLEAAGPRPGGVEALLRGADGYTDTIPLAKALDPATLVVFEMNGEPLPRIHGYPVRLIVPGMYGEKNVKWVTGIEVVDHDVQGFYEQQGWGPDFVIPIRSRFYEPDLSQPIRLRSARRPARDRVRRRQGDLARRGQPGRRPELARGRAGVPGLELLVGDLALRVPPGDSRATTSWRRAASTLTARRSRPRIAASCRAGGRGYHRITLTGGGLRWPCSQHPAASLSEPWTLDSGNRAGRRCAARRTRRPVRADRPALRVPARAPVPRRHRTDRTRRSGRNGRAAGRHRVAGDRVRPGRLRSPTGGPASQACAPSASTARHGCWRWPSARAVRDGLANCRFEQGDALALDWPDASVDAVVASRLFTVVDGAAARWPRCHRVLRPGGRCFLAEPVVGCWARCCRWPRCAWPAGSSAPAGATGRRCGAATLAAPTHELPSSRR